MANAAYVGSLVGVTLEIDQATLYKPEYCRILLGCRDVRRLPATAEGVLGDFFYDFSYEVDSIVVEGPPMSRIMIPTDGSAVPPSPKRDRAENYSANSAASSEGQTGAASQSVGTDFGKSYCQTLPPVAEQESEEESEEDDELLIDKIVRENGSEPIDKSEVSANNNNEKLLEKQVMSPTCNMMPNFEKNGIQAPITPVVEKEAVSLMLVVRLITKWGCLMLLWSLDTPCQWNLLSLNWKVRCLLSLVSWLNILFNRLLLWGLRTRG